MEFILSLILKSVEQVWLALLHNWPYLILSVVIATVLKLYINGEKISDFLSRYRGAGVLAATAAAVATPLCSCGTTAVILGMMVSQTTWAPIVAFMVSSPLTSPEGLVYSAGLFGWPFALAFYLASIVLGLAGGWVAAVLESRGWLADQVRLTEPAEASCACPADSEVAKASAPIFGIEVAGLQLSEAGAACCAGTVPVTTTIRYGDTNAGCACGTPIDDRSSGQKASRESEEAGRHISLSMLLKELLTSSRYLLTMFLGFAFVGYLLNGLIPSEWVTAIFGSGNIYNVPLAATLGLPFYINSEVSLPLVRALLDSGMSQGAALAFMIVGAGTSVGAIAGALTIARWRVIALVVGTLWVGAIVCGFVFDLALTLGLF